MKVIQFAKQLNNTELGKSATHDTYVLVPNEIDITDIFKNANQPITFHDIENSETITVRNTVAREKRIVGLGQYYRARDLSAGDEIVFESRTRNGNTDFIIKVVKHKEMLCFQKYKNGFEILTPERLSMIRSQAEQINDVLKIDYLCSEKKRNDSPVATDFYDISINGRSIQGNYSTKDIGMLSIEDGKIKVHNFYGWKKYVFKMEEL